MTRFSINRQRRVDHCLMFDRKITNTLSPRQRIAMFQTSQPGPSHSADKESYGEVMNRQNHRSSRGNCTKPINMTTNELMEWQYLLKRRLIEDTLQKRRNAVCSEIERTWFLQGSHLEKHRHNLCVTLELQDRGLMMWWLVKGELIEDAFPQHRKMNLKNQSSGYVLAQFFPWYNWYFPSFYIHYYILPCLRTKEKKRIVPRLRLNHNIRIANEDRSQWHHEKTKVLLRFAVYKTQVSDKATQC